MKWAEDPLAHAEPDLNEFLRLKREAGTLDIGLEKEGRCTEVSPGLGEKAGGNGESDTPRSVERQDTGYHTEIGANGIEYIIIHD
jgi:hypothetical protein